METVEIKNVAPASGNGLQISAESQLCALSRYYADRGLCKSVKQEAQKQMAQENATRELAPDAYRLSTLSDAAVGGCYRRGKESMAVNDLLIYFHETRQKRIRNLDFSETSVEEPQEESALAVAEKKSVGLSERIQKGRNDLKAALPTWFDPSEPDTTGAKKRFPLSAFAAIAAVAVSLMLIVASSVLVMRGESRTAELNRQITTAYSTSGDLQAKLESRDDLLLIRQIATEEYGMVSEEFVRTQYITLETEDSIETYEKEEDRGVGLSALLSAIGIR